MFAIVFAVHAFRTRHLCFVGIELVTVHLLKLRAHEIVFFSQHCHAKNTYYIS